LRTEHDIAAASPVKAISPARDRLQSRVLVALGAPVLLWITWRAIEYARVAGDPGSIYLLKAAAISAMFGLVAFRLRAATAGAAAYGSLICFDLTILTGKPDGGSVAHSGPIPLLLLFALTYLSTRFRQNRQPLGVAEGEERRGRNAAQVVANLGIGAVAAMQWYMYMGFRLPHGANGPAVFAYMQAPMLAALAEATADTVSSEIGQAIGGTPFLLTSFRRVSPGTDGAVSLVGTLAGVAAAALIALVGIPALSLDPADIVRVLIAAIAGLFFDSLLGASLERRGWIGNDLVNFASTAFAAALCYALLPHSFA
jgi:uncharacterized protein (TIGR00297 family)